MHEKDLKQLSPNQIELLKAMYVAATFQFNYHKKIKVVSFYGLKPTGYTDDVSGLLDSEVLELIKMEHIIRDGSSDYYEITDVGKDSIRKILLDDRRRVFRLQGK